GPFCCWRFPQKTLCFSSVKLRSPSPTTCFRQVPRPPNDVFLPSAMSSQRRASDKSHVPPTTYFCQVPCPPNDVLLPSLMSSPPFHASLPFQIPYLDSDPRLKNCGKNKIERILSLLNLSQLNLKFFVANFEPRRALVPLKNQFYHW